MRLLTELKSEKKRVKYYTFEWTKGCKKAFEDLKHAFITALVLAHYNAKLKTWMEIDLSDFVIAGVLSQMYNGMLRSIAFFSKKMSPAECNYMIYNKKLLAIVKSFKMWRPVKLYINHKNLEHFMTTKQLNR